MKKKQEPNYGLLYLIAIVATSLIHYFILSRMDLHSTIHLIVGLFIFSVIMGALLGIVERRMK